MKCNGCPFNDGLTEEATMIQNLGCLPTARDMIESAKRGKVISCHNNDELKCQGLAEYDHKLLSGKILPYSEWYHDEAK